MQLGQIAIIFEKKRTVSVLIVTIAAAVCFAGIAMVFFIPDLSRVQSAAESVIFSALFALLLVPVGLYFGLRKKTEPETLLFLLIAAGAAVAVRIAFFDYASKDFDDALAPWMYALRNLPGVSGWRYEIANYNMPYVYFLTLLAKQDMSQLYLLKLLSVAFDFAAAYYLMKLSSLFFLSEKKQMACFLAVLFLPTVIWNSSCWAQCDSIYTAFSLACLYYGLTSRPWLCTAMFSLGFIFKLQAVFIFPVLLLFLLLKKVKLRHMLTFPVLFVAAIVPAMLAGRSFLSSVSIYMGQMDEYPFLSLNAPSVYYLVNENVDFDMFSTAGILLAGSAVLALLFYAWSKKAALGNKELLLIAFLFAVGIPYLLPRMHERYFYIADLLSFTVFFINRRRWFIPLSVVYVSMRSYMPFLFNINNVGFKYLTIILFLVIIFTVLELTGQVSEKEKEYKITGGVYEPEDK